jgi:hypothetical protein
MLVMSMRMMTIVSCEVELNGKYSRALASV